MTVDHHLEERMDKFEEKIESKIDSIEKKVDLMMEQVMLGKHMIAFAKMVGWCIGVAATAIAVYNSFRGGGGNGPTIGH